MPALKLLVTARFNVPGLLYAILASIRLLDVYLHWDPFPLHFPVPTQQVALTARGLGALALGLGQHCCTSGIPHYEGGCVALCGHLHKSK